MEHIGDTLPLTELLDERRHLVEVARWMLGGTVAAERVTDEAYREWYGLSDGQRARIGAPGSWLTHVVGGLALARLSPSGPDGDARARALRREPCDDGPEREAGEVLLRAVGALSPAQRAAFVLDGIFGAAPGGGARPVRERTGPADPVDPVVAARAGLLARNGRPSSSAPRQDEVARAVRQACVDGDHEGLRAVLADDGIACFDGGGKIRALTTPVTGGEHVARNLLTLLSGRQDLTVATWPVNGRTGLVVRRHERVVAVLTLDLIDSRVARIWAVLNPDKLRSWNSVAPHYM
ncbi:RNA polymerase subunit sigma [Streptomyces sp. VRA16 Mangrove soil]|uniref:RNA polymerase subunit sigma n=1 Tax=Streptomyces sp. VRA16 Mangrove soil TaxID=2817434 RepID=UPI001A9FA70F|nr:RNA polymerase subunit sigma [Streptomyces sp. VRA16 Mangrove soil]MBO1332504.1 RNA polymerase subunit sigma [Streptomyces sp. VRA16 Mangrove soil]